MSKGTVVTALDLWLLLRGRVCPGSLVAGTELVGWHPMWGRGIRRAEAVSLGGLWWPRTSSWLCGKLNRAVVARTLQ